MKRIFGILAALAVAVGCSRGTSPEAEFVSWQVKYYPEGNLVDLYSSVYDDVMGSDFKRTDSVSAINFMKEELKSMRNIGIIGRKFKTDTSSAHSADPESLAKMRKADAERKANERPNMKQDLYEYCGLNGNHVRVSLKAVEYGKITPAQLVDAMIASIGTEGDLNELVKEWGKVESAAKKSGAFKKNFEKESETVRDALNSLPASLPHSPFFDASYDPHYRVISRDAFERMIKGNL